MAADSRKIDARRHSEAPSPARRSKALGLGFRRILDDDLPFLSRLYASTREQEMALVPWSREQKRLFLDQQFQAQHAHYMQHYPDAAWLIVEQGDETIGRLYLERWTREHRIIDIALLPQWRGRGLGAVLMRDVMDEAGAAGKAVSIHVEQNNPALRLYARLGFLKKEDKGVYHLMEWSPDGQANTAS